MRAVLNRNLLAPVRAPVQAPASYTSGTSALPLSERLAALGVLLVLVVTILA